MYPPCKAENSIAVGRERGEPLEGGWYKGIKVEGWDDGGRDDEWTKKDWSYYGVTIEGKQRQTQFKKRNKYRERRQRNLRKQTKRGLKDRWSTPELHKQRRKMKCVVGGGPFQFNHCIFSSRKGYNLPKTTKKGQQYRRGCQLYLGSQCNFYSVSPTGDVQFVVHSILSKAPYWSKKATTNPYRKSTWH